MRRTEFSAAPTANASPPTNNPSPKVYDIDRLLNGRTHYDRLFLTISQNIEPQVIRDAYKKIALKVHPDKCTHPRAKEAFQFLSEAFDILHDKSSQSTYYAACVAHTPYSRNPGFSRKPPTKKQPQTKWWEKRSLAEIFADLQRREAEEAVLRRNFIENTKSKIGSKKTIRDLQKAARICEELDLRNGQETSSLWPLPEDVEGLPGFVQAEKLSAILGHLRTTHLYCVFCSITFRDGDDLQRNCPGLTSEDH